MIKKVVVYFNKQLKFYESIKLVENQSNSDITGSCKRYLQMAPNQEVVNCVGKEIRIIGEFNDENLEEPFSNYLEPVLVVDCDEILRVRFPQMYEQSN